MARLRKQNHKMSVSQMAGFWADLATRMTANKKKDTHACMHAQLQVAHTCGICFALTRGRLRCHFSEISPWQKLFMGTPFVWTTTFFTMSNAPMIDKKISPRVSWTSYLVSPGGPDRTSFVWHMGQASKSSSTFSSFWKAPNRTDRGGKNKKNMWDMSADAWHHMHLTYFEMFEVMAGSFQMLRTG